MTFYVVIQPKAKIQSNSFGAAPSAPFLWTWMICATRAWVGKDQDWIQVWGVV